MQDVTFTSKIDRGLSALLVVLATACVLIATSLFMLDHKVGWALGLLTLAGGVLPVWFLFSTRYTLTDTRLVIRSGPFRWRIPLEDVRAVVPARSLIAGPALSLERLRVEYRRNRSVLISPDDPDQFMHEIKCRRRKAQEDFGS